jgi:hypothetical protein
MRAAMQRQKSAEDSKGVTLNGSAATEIAAISAWHSPAHPRRAHQPRKLATSGVLMRLSTEHTGEHLSAITP